jgi:hypothetical protein
MLLFSLKKLVIKAEQDLTGTEVGRRKMVGEGGEMTQTRCAHMNK